MRFLFLHIDFVFQATNRSIQANRKSCRSKIDKSRLTYYNPLLRGTNNNHFFFENARLFAAKVILSSFCLITIFFLILTRAMNIGLIKCKNCFLGILLCIFFSQISSNGVIEANLANCGEQFGYEAV